MASTRPKKRLSLLRLPSLKKKEDKPEDDASSSTSSLLQSHILTLQISQEALENMFVDFSKSLWHAFNSLAKDDFVQKSRLKVVVSNIGRELGFEKAEEFMDTNEETRLNFLSFFEIIQKEMLDKLRDNCQERQSLSDPDFEHIHQVCWMLCANERSCKKCRTNSDSVSEKELDSVFESEEPEVDRDTNSLGVTPLTPSIELDPCALHDDDAFKMWRIFNFFVECDDNGNPSIPLRLDKEEAEYICNLFIASSGQLNKEKELICFKDLRENITFEVFLEIFEKTFACNLSATSRSYVIANLYDTILLDTVKKGTMLKQGNKMKNWKEYYFVLTSKHLKYYINAGEDEMKKCIHFEDSWKLEVPPQESGSKPHRFLLHTATKLFELSASSIKEKYEWMSVFQVVIDHNADHKEDEVSIQRQLAIQRKTKREEKREAARDQAQLVLDQTRLMEHLMKDLEEERLAHALVEAKLLEETSQRLSEQARCQGLEVEMAKNVAEEAKKRRDLQDLCDEQRKMYDDERFRRMSLMEEREEGARLLKEAKENIELLEIEKEVAVEKLKEAASRLHTAEEIRTKMEDAFTQWKSNH